MRSLIVLIVVPSVILGTEFTVPVLDFDTRINLSLIHGVPYVQGSYSGWHKNTPLDVVGSDLFHITGRFRISTVKRICYLKHWKERESPLAVSAIDGSGVDTLVQFLEAPEWILMYQELAFANIIGIGADSIIAQKFDQYMLVPPSGSQERFSLILRPLIPESYVADKAIQYASATVGIEGDNGFSILASVGTGGAGSREPIWFTINSDHKNDSIPQVVYNELLAAALAAGFELLYPEKLLLMRGCADRLSLLPTLRYSIFTVASDDSTDAAVPELSVATELVLSPEEYMEIDGHGICRARVSPTEPERECGILGMNFMRNSVVLFDPKNLRIGFGQPL